MLNRRGFATVLSGLLVLPLVSAVAAGQVAAQQVAAKQVAAKPSAELAGIAHVAIRVQDLDAAVAFYEKLGFVRAFALSRDGKVYEAFIKINDQQFIELYPVDEKNTQVGFLHVCFYGHDLQSVHDYYVAQGLSPNAVRTAGAGNLLFTMPGPDTPTGPQNMEYTQYMPGSMHSKAVGQFLGPDRISKHMAEVDVAFVNPAEASTFYRDKVAFIPKAGPTPEPGAKTLFALPGASSEFIRLAAVPDLHLRARIVLTVDLAAAAATLHERGIAYAHGSHEIDSRNLVVTDPDGNQIVLSSER